MMHERIHQRGQKLAGFTLPDREEVWITIIALLAALLLASHQISNSGVAGLLGSYAYWLVRVSIETTLFVGALYLIERYVADDTSSFFLYLCAMLVSLVPFTLAITSFDLIVGLPELGIDPSIAGSTAQRDSRFGAFALELVFLLDNHASICGLLMLPRICRRAMSLPVLSEEASVTTQSASSAPTLFDSLQPPLRGPVYWVEAQEHYVRVTTAEESRMVLHRFSDAIRELNPAEGMQVHRSHWVAFSAVESLIKEGQAMKLKIWGDAQVPVSRSYRAKVEERFAEQQQADN